MCLAGLVAVALLAEPDVDKIAQEVAEGQRLTLWLQRR